MKYVVTLGWKCKFEFEDGKTAVDFATIALEHMAADNDDQGVSIDVEKDGGESGGE